LWWDIMGSLTYLYRDFCTWIDIHCYTGHETFCLTLVKPCKLSLLLTSWP
jgi:hypothetical protein